MSHSILNLLPSGTIIPYGGSNLPSGWYFCEGIAISRTEHPSLFAAIGTLYGSGDGSTTFNLPDMREAVPVGTGYRAFNVSEHDVYTLSQFKDDQIEYHEHEMGAVCYGNDNNYVGSLGSFSYAPTTGAAISCRSGTTTHGKQLGLNFIIKK